MRDNIVEIVVGAREIGKTFITVEEIKRYVMSDTKTGRKARPALIFDINNEEKYRDFKPLDFDITEEDEYLRAKEIRAITVPKAYRILPFKKNRQPMTTKEKLETCLTMANHYKNGLMVLEDINKYMLSNIKIDFMGALIGVRHNGVDLMIHYQSLSEIPPKLWRNTNYIRWHKQIGNIDAGKSKIPNYELSKIAEYIVNDHYQKGDIYYYLWLDVMGDKLINVTDEDFKSACRYYTSINPKEIKDLQKVGSINGKNVESREAAVNYWIETHNYYINSNIKQTL